MTSRQQLTLSCAIGLAETRLGKGAWQRMPEAERNVWLGDVEFGLLPALAATLPALGLALVPVVATGEMNNAGAYSQLHERGLADAYSAMVAAAPDLLREDG